MAPLAGPARAEPGCRDPFVTNDDPAGDEITLDVPARQLRLEVDDHELEARAAAWTPPERTYTSGYAWLYVEHVLGADAGADFDFLRGQRGHAVPRDSH